jgi:hypothetical protein
MELTTCPDCGALAEVVWRAALESTDGPVEHAKVNCVAGHWFLLPSSRLRSPQVADPRPAGHTQP